MKPRRSRAVLVAAVVAGCADANESGAGDVTLAEFSGHALAERYCQGCHLLPDPGMLDKATWSDAVLPMMGWRLGIYGREGLREDSVIERGRGGHLVERAGLFPADPQIPRAAWEKIVDYYVSAAPENLPPQAPREVSIGLDHFRVRMPMGFRPDPPMISLVRIAPGTNRVYAGDVKQDFSTLDALIVGIEVDPIQTLGMESAPVHARLGSDRLDVLLMGKLLPTNEPSGILRSLITKPDESGYAAAVRLIDGLHRPVHAAYGDLNGDGVEDLVISEFGFHIGRLTWYEGTPAGDFTPHVLKALPGAIATHLRDVDGDGRLDVVALLAQGAEGVFLFRNLGGGRFEERALLRFPATYGSTSFELADFNGDGHFDILLTNGDNGDYRPVAKPYHGVRIFLNHGANGFEEEFFFPLYGAYGARAKDFDLDGDLDIAVTAFYPDFQSVPHEGFVYLEQGDGLSFTASTFAGVDRGRWFSFDVADLEGDGDDDIVLGSFVAFDPVGDTRGLHQRWLEDGPAIVILENTVR